MITIAVAIVEDRIPQAIAALGVAPEVVPKIFTDAIAVLAREFVPVDTGSLKDTIESVIDPDSGGWAVVAGDTSGGYKGGGKWNNPAGKPVDYAVVAEQHTPYMTPAYDQGFPTIAAGLVEIFTQLGVL